MMGDTMIRTTSAMTNGIGGGTSSTSSSRYANTSTTSGGGGRPSPPSSGYSNSFKDPERSMRVLSLGCYGCSMRMFPGGGQRRLRETRGPWGCGEEDGEMIESMFGREGGLRWVSIHLPRVVKVFPPRRNSREFITICNFSGAIREIKDHESSGAAHAHRRVLRSVLKKKEQNVLLLSRSSLSLSLSLSLWMVDIILW